MSHVVEIETEVRDLNAVKAACKRLGLEFVEGKTNYVWYGRHMGDYPLPKGVSQEDLGKCSHVVRVPGVRYELGLVRNPATNGYKLAFDFYGQGNLHDGRKLQKAICNQNKDGTYDKKCGKFLQAYGAEFAKMQMRARGYMVQEKKVGDTIRLTVTGV
ncbi:MAG: hypothetical protein LBK99_16555 [Opitutaceae bacterium]|jgi:hypothetical protein|nr:hypothetical protein [Opitutaceae bacterium]